MKHLSAAEVYQRYQKKECNACILAAHIMIIGYFKMSHCPRHVNRSKIAYGGQLQLSFAL